MMITRSIGLAVLGGVALGATNALTSALGSAYGPFTQTPGEGIRWLEFVSAWLGTPWAWSLFAFTAGWLVGRPRRAILLATLGLLAAVPTYYAAELVLGINDRFSAMVEVVIWSVISLVIGPLMGACGALAARPGLWRLIPGLVMPAMMLYYGLTTRLGPDHIQPWAQHSVVGFAIVLATALVLRALWFLRGDPQRDGSMVGL
jgi:hypothetical protein